MKVLQRRARGVAKSLSLFAAVGALLLAFGAFAHARHDASAVAMAAIRAHLAEPDLSAPALETAKALRHERTVYVPGVRKEAEAIIAEIDGYKKYCNNGHLPSGNITAAVSRRTSKLYVLRKDKVGLSWGKKLQSLRDKARSLQGRRMSSQARATLSSELAKVEDTRKAAKALRDRMAKINAKTLCAGTKNPPGGSCSRNDDCKSNRCDEGQGTCIVADGTAKKNEYCTHDDQCETNYCSGHKCRDKKSLGTLCSRDSVCESDHCNKTCVPQDGKGKQGEYCNHDNQCKSPYKCRLRPRKHHGNCR